MKYTGTFWHSYSYRFFCQQPVTEREHTYIPAKKKFYSTPPPPFSLLLVHSLRVLSCFPTFSDFFSCSITKNSHYLLFLWSFILHKATLISIVSSHAIKIGSLKKNEGSSTTVLLYELVMAIFLNAKNYVILGMQQKEKLKLSGDNPY